MTMKLSLTSTSPTSPPPMPFFISPTPASASFLPAIPAFRPKSAITPLTNQSKFYIHLSASGYKKRSLDGDKG